MKRLLPLLILAAAARPSPAQNPPGPPPGDDPLARILFPPELVMAHQQELNLQESQRATILAEIQRAQSRFTETQWKLSGEAEKLHRLLQAAPIDEAKVLAQVDAVLALEREVKKTQIALLVRIRNALTAEQQAKLAELRRHPGG